MAEVKTQIFRRSKTNNYSIIHNEILRRSDISWKAKGIMCYVLSLPDDWVIYLEELIEHATDKKASFRSGWNELIEKGYVSRFPIRNEAGKIVEWRTEIRENVDMKASSPLTDFQEVENQEVENQEVENRKLLSTYSFTNNLSVQSTKEYIDRFELLWERYPKKTQKKKAIEQFKKKIKNDSDLNVFEKGYFNYLKYIEITDWYHPQELFRWIRDERYRDEYDLAPKVSKGNYRNNKHRIEEVPSHINTQPNKKEPDIDWVAEAERSLAERGAESE
ncbi:hypothetical protein [Enterococcus malodoratus]|uniref:hypothetical protein n=1 Tax=Enterococcus malodoratus TaxID=71451 RepID=UPI002074244A|nr:hypothetical protein [Enterococcus malodoratus]